MAGALTVDDSMKLATCLDRDQLKRFLLGDLPADEWEAVSVHLRDCERCDGTLALLDSEEDTVVQALRKMKVMESTEHPSSYRLAEKQAKSLLRSALPTDSMAERYLRDYQLLQIIGRGGMGTVYRAMHRKLRRQVAIKVLPTQNLADPHAIARFEREMQVIGQLRHPAIVQATDCGESDGIHFLVMELVEGVDLARLIKSLGPLQPSDACELVRRASVGLAHAHECGIIHRDVKPSNLMLTSDGDVKILDLGLVRLVGEPVLCDELTTVGQLMGTVDYMAPEQFENSHTADERCDVYGLAATLYKLLTGHSPYARVNETSPLAKLRRIATEPPVAIATRRPDLAPELCALIDRSLSRDPTHRPASMTEFAEQLGPFCMGCTLTDLAVRARSTPIEEAQVSGVPQQQLAEKHETKQLLKPAQSAAGDGRRHWKYSAGLALLFGLAFFAVATIITLQTSTGQLVIETTAPDVQVEIKRSGQPVKSLTLNKLSDRLQLRTGEYEVSVVGPADHLHIENDKFTLRRGETVVARVVHEDKARSHDNPISAVASSDFEPRFDGKSITAWIQVLYEDRSPNQVVTALRALHKLGLDQKKPAEAVRAIFHAVRFHDESTSVPVTEGKGTTTLWSVALNALDQYDRELILNEASQLLDDDGYQPKDFIPYLLGLRGEITGDIAETLRSQLIRMIEAGQNDERLTTIRALESVLNNDPSKFTDQCRQWLTAEDLWLRLHACNALIRNKQATAEVVATLRALLPGRDQIVRIEAIALLGQLGSDAREAVPDLIAIAEQPFPDSAATYERVVPSKTAGFLVFQLPQLQAINSLAAIGDRSAIPTLIRQWKYLRSEEGFGKGEGKSRSVRDALLQLSGTTIRVSTRNDRVTHRWYLQGRSLGEWCLRFVDRLTPKNDLADIRQSIDSLASFHFDADVQSAFADAVTTVDFQSQASLDRYLELLELLRPHLPGQSKVDAVFEAIDDILRRVPTVAISQHDLDSDSSFVGGRFDLAEELLKVLVKVSKDAEARAFDLIAEAIEQPDRSLPLYIHVMRSLERPQGPQVARLLTALEKARDPEYPERNESIDLAIAHLRPEKDD